MASTGRGVGLSLAAVLVAVVSCKEVAVTAVDVSSVTVSAPVTRLAVGQTAHLTARVEDQAGRELHRAVTWSSSDPSVASVSPEGMVTGHANGDATISATVDGRSDTIAMTVGDEPVASVEVVPGLAVMQVGDTVRLRVIARSTSGTELTGRVVGWATSDPNVVDIGINGLATAVGVGSATVTATVEGIQGQADLSVNASIMTVSTVRIEPATATLVRSESVQLNATALTSNGAVVTGRTATWTSANTAVATVSEDGLAYGVGQGTATINGTVDGVSGSAEVTVTLPPAMSLEVTPQSTTLSVGDNLQFTARVLATDGLELPGVPVAWSTGDPAVASVSATGLVTANAVGTVTLTATGGGVTGTATVYVVLRPVALIEIAPVTPQVLLGDSILLAGNPLDADGQALSGRQVSWSTGDPSIASMSPNGGSLQQVWLHGVSDGSTWVYAESGARRDSVLATVLPLADVSISKAASATQVLAGEIITFTIDVTNDGPSTASAVVLTDTLPANAVFVDATPGPTRSGNVLSWSISSLGAGSSQSFTVRVTAPASGAVTNVAAATAGTADDDLSDNRASVTVGIDPLADLVVSKTASAAAVDAGAPIDYTITVRNNGLGAADDVTVVDTLPANADFVGASGGVQPAGGLLVWTPGALAPGASVSFDVRVTAPVQGTVRNAAEASTSVAESSAANNHASVSTTVRAANLAVTKTGPSVATPGSSVTYTIELRNNGPGTARDIVLTDDLPNGAGFVSASGGGNHSNGVVTWMLPSMASGATPATFTVEITAAQTGPMVNTASVQAATVDPSPGNNTSSVTTTVALADLSVSKSGPAAVTAGDQITYTLTVRNDGPTAAANTQLVDELPSGVTYLSSSQPPSSQSADELTWNLGSMANGASTSIDVRVRAPTQATSVTNVATISSTTNDPNSSNNQSQVTTTVAALADLRLTKTGPAEADPGEEITYEIVVSNDGPSSANGVALTDQLPPGVTFVGANRGGDEVNGVVSWPTRGFNAGESVRYTLTMTAPSTLGPFTNTASVTSSVDDPDDSNNSASALTTVTLANVAVSVSGPANVTAADMVEYTVVVSNAGPTAAFGVQVTDTLPGNATFVDSSPARTPSGGVLTWNLQSLASGDQRTFTVRVLGPPGGGTMRNAAHAGSSTTDPQVGNNLDAVSTSVVPAADLRIAKSAPASIVLGDTLVYTIDVTNDGPSAATDVIVTDTLPDGYVADPGNPTPTGNLLTWDVGSLAAGGSASFTVRVVPTTTGTVRNAAAVEATTLDPAPGNNTDAVTSTVQSANLEAALAPPAPIAPGASITYQATQVNEASGPAFGLGLQTTIPANTTYDGHQGGTYSAGTGVITLSAPLLAAGDSQVMDVSVTAPPSRSVRMSAPGSASTVDPGPNDTATVKATVSAREPELAGSPSVAPTGTAVQPASALRRPAAG